MPLAAHLRRGLLAGLMAGLAAGLFHSLASEPLIEQALGYEAAGGAEVFSRGVQRGGLVAATALYGVALGGIFGLVYHLLARQAPAHRRDRAPAHRRDSAWHRSIALALAGFATFFLVPFLKYPANPPGVGDPSTIGSRTSMYVAMLAIALLASLGAWAGARRLAALAPHRRHLLVGAVYIAAVGAAYGLLPANPDPVGIPAQLLWSFRTASAAGQALLWSTLGAAFGLLTLRNAGS
ncbi:MAG: CbtA family protein [bacterium]